MAKKGKIMVERETFEKNDKTYFSYFIKGSIRGKDVKVAVVPPDKGGYAVLDIVFGNEMSAELVANPFEIKDEATGKVITGNSYLVRTVDENGEIYEKCVKLYRIHICNYHSIIVNYSSACLAVGYDVYIKYFPFFDYIADFYAN